MRPRGWNYGPPIPLAPITVHEPEERTVDSGLLHPNGGTITWVVDRPVVGFQPPSERGPYDAGSTWRDQGPPIGDYTVVRVVSPLRKDV